MRIVRKITLAALLASVSIVLTRFFGIVIPLGGFPSLSLDLGSVPILLSGIVLGPIFGGIVGLTSDLVGFAINPRGGIFHFGFTINSILTGVIPGLIFVFLKNKNLKFTKIAIISILYMLGTYYFLVVRSSDSTLIKIISNTLLFVVAFSIIMVDYKIKNKQLKLVIFTVLVVEVFVFIALTPIWLYQLYELPYFISVLSRVFRAVLLVPLKTALTYQSLKILKN
jgi:ECF transporter S component (folate family)